MVGVSVVDVAALRAERLRGKWTYLSTYLTMLPTGEAALPISKQDADNVLALLDELDTLRATVARIGNEVLTWEQTAETLCAPEDPDEEHLVVAEVLESRAYRIRAALVSPAPDPTTP